jgi:hypothetical protein
MGGTSGLSPVSQFPSQFPVSQFPAKHLPAYLDEMCFRFNNRKNPYLFRDTMLKLIDSPNLEYKHLTAKVQDAA